MSHPAPVRRTLPQALGPLALGIGLAALAASGVLAQQQPKPAAGERRALKVGVVDVGFLFREYKRKDEFENAINAQRKRLKDELDAEQENLRKLRTEFEKTNLRKGSEPWLLEREKIKMAQYRWELKGERMQTALKNEVEHNTLQILQEIEGTIAAYGKRYGYDLVLKIDKAEREDATGERGDLVEHFQERIFRAQIGDVLYHEESVNITKSVLAYLNHKNNLDYWAKKANK
ncbi:MAG: OmpH family outer membrane protein [Planctomycetota bacterium]